MRSSAISFITEVEIPKGYRIRTPCIRSNSAILRIGGGGGSVVINSNNLIVNSGIIELSGGIGGNEVYQNFPLTGSCGSVGVGDLVGGSGNNGGNGFVIWLNQ